jgi:ParB-like nuclease domain
MSGKKQSLKLERIAPKTQKVSVPVAKLVPDPNNPRFTTADEDAVPSSEILDAAISGRTYRRMQPTKEDPFRIGDLCRSIKENGWHPVDAMFVRRLPGSDDRYVVLEGNRRLTAINRLLEDEKLDKELRQTIETISVLEVLDDGQDEEAIRNQITYLLGVRHHGSLKRWSAFAQAANIYQRYNELASETDATFEWDEAVAAEVASSLSIPVARVSERLRVFIAMKQLGALPAVAAGGGEIKDRHYSLVEEALKRKDLKDFLPQNQETFSLSDEATDRFLRLCHFDRPGRDGSPITDPPQWRALGKILTDDNLVERENNLRLVIENKQLPSDVWAKRSAELRRLTWETWLQRLRLRLSQINIGDTFRDVDAIALIRRLRDLLRTLAGRESS